MHATTADHEFTNDWDRRMEEILVPIRSVKVEGLSQEMQRKDGNKGEEKALNSRKSKGAIETLPKK